MVFWAADTACDVEGAREWPAVVRLCALATGGPALIKAALLAAALVGGILAGGWLPSSNEWDLLVLLSRPPPSPVVYSIPEWPDWFDCKLTRRLAACPS